MAKCYNELCNKDMPGNSPSIVIRIHRDVKLSVKLCEDCIVKHSWRISRVNAMVDYEAKKKDRGEDYV